MTVDRGTGSEVETVVREQAWELVDRVHVFLSDGTFRRQPRVELRLSGATSLFNDVIVVGLMLRDKDPVL